MRVHLRLGLCLLITKQARPLGFREEGYYFIQHVLSDFSSECNLFGIRSVSNLEHTNSHFTNSCSTLWIVTSILFSLKMREEHPRAQPNRDPNLFPSPEVSRINAVTIGAEQPHRDMWETQSSSGGTQRSGPEPILPDDSDESAFPGAFTPPAHLQVRNDDRRSLSSIDIPSFSNVPAGLQEAMVDQRDFAEVALRSPAPLHVGNLTDGQERVLTGDSTRYTAYQPYRVDIV